MEGDAVGSPRSDDSFEGVPVSVDIDDGGVVSGGAPADMRSVRTPHTRANGRAQLAAVYRSRARAAVCAVNEELSERC